MASHEHLDILRQGVIAWNNWRTENKMIIPDLYRAELNDLQLSGAYLSWADLREAKLSHTDLSLAHLNVADLRGADLTQADFSGTELREANLGRAILRGTKLIKATLLETIVDESIMHGTILWNIDLSRVKGLESVIHEGPSEMSFSTIYSSQGNIPAIFLRGIGVNDELIAPINATAGGVQFYSCFISYSSKDQEFATRLHDDLQNKGIRCWFAPEDLKTGDKWWSAIDEAIRVHDKLMIVLSENSVKSSWVETEVKAAFEKERLQNRIVLFPIRLDDAATETDQAWAADIGRTRQIGDFRHWKNHGSYQKAIDRLLRDLKADSKVESDALGHT